MTDFKDKFLKKRADIQSRFTKLEGQRKGLVSQRADLDRAIAVIMEEQVRLQGEFRLIEDLSNGGKDKKLEPTMEIPKKKKKK